MFFDTIFGRNFGRIYISKAILVCHGFPYEAGSVLNKGYGDLAKFFSIIAPTMVFDFSGCGNSRGFFSVKYWVEDLKGIAEKFEKVSLIGYSMGGLIAIRASAELENLEKIIAVSTPIPDIFSEERLALMFENANRIMRIRSFEDFRKEMESVYEMDPRKYIKKIKAPKLIVHGTRDEIVPFDCGEAIYQNAEEPKAFLKVVNGDHFLRRNFKVMGIVADWISGRIKDKEFEIIL
ncbi:MAG: alpha/beta hydrolase [Archaeoglobaceae archaeon]|nr:alpha/beta hydrolase [Archaeoglobaceae archaeon]MDW8118595.1 alpha/beta hydrolase [Archaeoglobaceae archaeon]